MQFSLFPDDCDSVLIEIHRRLLRHFGRPQPCLLLDPVSQLVMGLVGGRTHGAVSRSAFEVLFLRFGSWEAVRDGQTEDVYGSIAAVTFAEVKAWRLKAALAAVTQINGRLTLDGLSGLTVEDALAWLERLPGVGRKVSAATLNFSTLRKPALVIDTHHLRVLRRLEVVGVATTFTAAYDRVMPMLPAGWTAAELDDHHQVFKTLGQRICRHAAPDCHRCPLRDLCPAAPHGSPPDGAGRAWGIRRPDGQGSNDGHEHVRLVPAPSAVARRT